MNKWASQGKVAENQVIWTENVARMTNPEMAVACDDLVSLTAVQEP